MALGDESSKSIQFSHPSSRSSRFRHLTHPITHGFSPSGFNGFPTPAPSSLAFPLSDVEVEVELTRGPGVIATLPDLLARVGEEGDEEDDLYIESYKVHH